MTDVQPTGAVHPVAALFPLLADDELQELAEDIREHGLRQPITLDPTGLLLDGRNRVSACRLADVEPTFVTYSGGPTAFILSQNVARRHMTKGQRAMVVVQAQTFSSGKFQGKGAIAKAAGLSGSLLSRAIAVKEHAPELVEMVIAGEVSLNDAYMVARWAKMAAAMPPPTRDPVTNQVTIRIPATIDEADAALARIFEEREAQRHYLGAFKRIYRIADDSELGQQIAALERSLADDDDEDDDELAENLFKEGSAR